MPPFTISVTVFVVVVLLAMVFLAPIGDADVFVTRVVVVLLNGDFLAVNVDVVVRVVADGGDARFGTPSVDDFVVAVRVVVEVLVIGL